MAEKKAFLLRIDPALWEKIEQLAQSDLRSVNSEIEFLLREVVAKRTGGEDKTPKKESE